MTGISEPVGLDIPNYRLIKRVGEGAFGEVWLAEEILTRIYRAIKIIPTGAVKKQRIELEGVRQYQQRSRGHPHLVQVLTVGETSDAFYYVMEAADNDLGTHTASAEDYEPRTLEAVLTRQGRLSRDTALDYFDTILEAVDHLHRSGLDHRDLKPATLLFVDGTLKLADVGLASRDHSGMAGTPGYLTPQGKPDDVYAAGIIFYQMLTGQPASRFPQLPEEWDASSKPKRDPQSLHLLNHVCHSDADKREQSVDAIRSTIQRIGHGPHRRVGIRSLVGVGALLLLVVFIAATFLNQPEPLPGAQVDWSDVEFVTNTDLAELTLFPNEGDDQPSSIQVTWGSLDHGILQLTGSFRAFYASSNPDTIVSLLLAVDDQIVNPMYWDIPGTNGRELSFEKRRFALRVDVLERFSADTPSVVFIVYAAAEDYDAFRDEYRLRHHNNDKSLNRLEIGRIRLKE